MRISKEMLEQIDSLCEKTGNCRTAFIKASIELALDGHTQFDFGNEEKEEPKITVEPVPTIKVIDID